MKDNKYIECLVIIGDNDGKQTEIRSLIEDLGTVPYEMREPIEQKF